MKTNYDEYFSEEKIKEFSDRIEKVAKNTIAKLLGFNNFEEVDKAGIDLPNAQVKLAKQKVPEIITADIFAKGEDIKNLWLAISDMNSIRINDVKSNIGG